VRKTRAIRVAGSAFVSVLFCLEGGCAGGRPSSAPSDATQPAPDEAYPSSSFKEKSSSSLPPSLLSAYETARARAWDPSRRFKALFKAEVSPKIGPVGRGYFSVWWDGATGTLQWRSSAPIGGSGRGGFLRRGRGGDRSADGSADDASADGTGTPLPGKLAPDDALACIFGVPEAQLPSPPPFKENPKTIRLFLDSKRSVLIDARGQVVEMAFPNGETVTLQPGEGVPRRIEAKGPGGHAVLTLESYSSWPEGEAVPPL
jgi:hypothetical protein